MLLKRNQKIIITSINFLAYLKFESHIKNILNKKYKYINYDTQAYQTR